MAYDLGGYNAAGFNNVSWPKDFKEDTVSNYKEYDNNTETNYLIKGLESYAGQKIRFKVEEKDCGQELDYNKNMPVSLRLFNRYGFKKDTMDPLYPAYRVPSVDSTPMVESRENQEVLNQEFTGFAYGLRKLPQDYGLNLPGDLPLDLRYENPGLNFTDYNSDYKGTDFQNSGINGGENAKKLGKLNRGVIY